MVTGCYDRLHFPVSAVCHKASHNCVMVLPFSSDFYLLLREISQNLPPGSLAYSHFSLWECVSARRKFNVAIRASVCDNFVKIDAPPTEPWFGLLEENDGMNLFHSATEKRLPFTRSTSSALMRLLLLTTLLLVGLSLARPAHAQSGVHTVIAGETLSEIAQRYGTDMATLVSLNGLSDPRTIWIGQRLSVPGAGNGAGVAVAYSPPAGSSTYVVKAGDSLSAIAAASGISLDELAAMNGIAPLAHVIIGQRLAVPAGFGTRASTGTAVNKTLGYNESMHVVSSGQSLGAIANQYGVTTASIIERNGISNPSLVAVGQRLVIPNAQVQATNSAHASGFPSNVSFPPTSGKWIRVDLSTQQLTAYVGSTPQQVFTISSGLPETPTVTRYFPHLVEVGQAGYEGRQSFCRHGL